MIKLSLITFIFWSSLFAAPYANVYEAMAGDPNKVAEMSKFIQQSNSIAANGNLIESLKYTLKAKEIGAELFGPNSDLMIQLNSQLGFSYYTIGDFSTSLEYFLNMIKHNQNGLSLNPLNRTTVYATVGTLYNHMSNYSKAIEYYLIAIDNLKTIQLSPNMYYLLGNLNKSLANNFFNLNDLKNAIFYQEQSLQYYDSNLELLVASYHRLEKFYNQLGEKEKASFYKEKALKIVMKNYLDINFPKHISAGLLGDIYFENKNYDDALKCYIEALEYREKFVSNDLQISHGYNYNKIGHAYKQLGKHKEAIEWFEKSNNILIELTGNVNYLIGNILSEEYYAINDLNNSYLKANLSFNSLKKHFSNSFQNTPNEGKENLLNNFSNIINNYIKVGHKYHEANPEKRIANEVFTNWINQKGILNEFENLVYSLKQNNNDKELLKQVDDLTYYKRLLSIHLQTPPMSKNSLESYNAKTKQLEQSIFELEQLLASKVEKFKIVMGMNNVQIKDISSNLSSGTLYIDYILTDDAYYTFTLDHSGNINFIKIADRNTIEQAITDFRTDIDYIINEKSGILSQEDENKLNTVTQQKLAKLYNLLLKPLEMNMKGKNTLLISPDGLLNLIPFEALYAESNYLIKSKEIVYTPSAKDFIRINKLNKNIDSNETIIFSNPDYNAANNDKNNTVDTSNLRSFYVLKGLSQMNFEPLLGSKQEAENIKQVSKKSSVKIFEKNESSEDNLLKVKSPHILHLSTHGFFLEDENQMSNPLLLSGIVLAGANTSLIFGQDKGIVTALKLSGIDLSKTDLVVLSACDTGRGVIKSGNGVAGLNKAFISAGAKNILMSLWSVADKETVELMTEFYLLNQNESYSKALRDTKMKMIQTNRHPFYWSAFILSGKE